MGMCLNLPLPPKPKAFDSFNLLASGGTSLLAVLQGFKSREMSASAFIFGCKGCF